VTRTAIYLLREKKITIHLKSRTQAFSERKGKVMEGRGRGFYTSNNRYCGVQRSSKILHNTTFAAASFIDLSMFEYGKILNCYCCIKVKFKFIHLSGRPLTNTEQQQQQQQQQQR
jgi:hypothetical protein